MKKYHEMRLEVVLFSSDDVLCTSDKYSVRDDTISDNNELGSKKDRLTKLLK